MIPLFSILLLTVVFQKNISTLFSINMGINEFKFRSNDKTKTVIVSINENGMFDEYWKTIMDFSPPRRIDSAVV